MTTTNSLDDLGLRLAAIEERMANLLVSDLPLAALQRKLEADWQPNGGVLLEPKSVGPAALTTDVPVLATAGTRRKFAFGAGTVGASTTVTITHGLGATPIAVFTSAFIVGTANPPNPTGVAPTTFTVQNQHAIVLNFFWLAIG